jgi:hypothetical protein
MGIIFLKTVYFQYINRVDIARFSPGMHFAFIPAARIKPEGNMHPQS